MNFNLDQDPLLRKKWLLYPDNRLKQMWDLWIVFLLGYVATIFTYKTSFIDEITSAQFGFDLFVDICFLADIVMTFFVVTQDKNGLFETRRVRIAKNYLRSFFFLDVFTTIPWGLIEKSKT